MKILLFLAGMTSVVQAQENHEVLVPWKAIIQYSSGQSSIQDSSGSKRALSFKDAVYEGETVVVDADAILKVVDRDGCIGVFYGPAKATAPKAEKTWSIKSRASRWICHTGESIQFSGRDNLKISTSGEILVNGNRAMCLRGSCQVQETTLDEKTPYSIADIPKKLQIDAEKIYDWNAKLKPPSESTPLKKPEIAKIKVEEGPTWRFTLGANMGPGIVYHDNSDRNLKGLTYFGGRLQFIKKLETSGFITALQFGNFEDESNKNTTANQTQNGIRGKLDRYSLEFGSRTNFSRWWSPYYRAGFAYERLKTWVNASYGQNQSYYDNNEYEYYSLVGAGGLDALLYSKSFPYIGFYGNLELDISRSLMQGARRASGAPHGVTIPNEAKDDTKGITSVDAAVGLGGFIQF